MTKRQANLRLSIMLRSRNSRKLFRCLLLNGFIAVTSTCSELFLRLLTCSPLSSSGTSFLHPSKILSSHHHTIAISCSTRTSARTPCNRRTMKIPRTARFTHTRRSLPRVSHRATWQIRAVLSSLLRQINHPLLDLLMAEFSSRQLHRRDNSLFSCPGLFVPATCNRDPWQPDLHEERAGNELVTLALP